MEKMICICICITAVYVFNNNSNNIKIITAPYKSSSTPLQDKPKLLQSS